MNARLAPDASPNAPRIPAFHLAVRFILEIAVFAGFGIWGWHVGSGGIFGVLLTVLFVVIAATVWAVFRVAGDPGGGRPIVAVPGWARLLLEFAMFGFSAYGIWTSWSRAAAETLLTALGLHYALTWERSRWMLRGSSSNASTEE